MFKVLVLCGMITGSKLRELTERSNFGLIIIFDTYIVVYFTKHIQREVFIMEELLKLAESGDTDAMYQLGRGYQFAEFEEKPDFEKAFQWYQKAAKLNHIEAMTSMADALMLGRGCKMDRAMGSMYYQEVYELAKSQR